MEKGDRFLRLANTQVGKRKIGIDSSTRYTKIFILDPRFWSAATKMIQYPFIAFEN